MIGRCTVLTGVAGKEPKVVAFIARDICPKSELAKREKAIHFPTLWGATAVDSSSMLNTRSQKKENVC